jgi:hypothetical protein
MTDWTENEHQMTFPGMDPKIDPDTALEWLEGDVRVIIIANWNEEIQDMEAGLQVAFEPNRVPKDVNHFMKELLTGLVTQMELGRQEMYAMDEEEEDEIENAD